jgi:RimJ/RimL family protein N-acetyltransferase
MEDRLLTRAGGTLTAVSLRPLVWTDLDAVHALTSRMEVVRYMLLPLCSRADTEQFLRKALTESADRPWRSIVRAICAPDLAGVAGIGIVRGVQDGEIWYLIAPERWEQGIASATVPLLLDLGFGELGLHRIWATCLPENPASIRVLEKAGMRREGLLSKHLKIHGEWRSCYLYAILDEEWRPG